MSTVPLRLILPAAIAAALLLAGCTPQPSAPQSTPEPRSTTQSNGEDGEDRDDDDIEVAWLDDGRSFAVVTWGSSCAPLAEDSTASGQTVAVTLVETEPAACADSFAPRASLAGMPDGVDVTKDVEVMVTYGAVKDDADLDRLPAAPTGESSQEPSAGWYDDDGIVLLTWGSSTCPPILSDVQSTDAGATVTFADEERVCTMDLAPRLTIVPVPDDERDDDLPFTLTLKGDGLDGQVEVIG